MTVGDTEPASPDTLQAVSSTPTGSSRQATDGASQQEGAPHAVFPSRHGRRSLLRGFVEIFQRFRRSVLTPFARQKIVHDYSDGDFESHEKIAHVVVPDWGRQKSSERRRTFRKEEQGLLRAAFAFSLGVLAYFELPEEPNLFVLSGLTAVFCVAALRSHLFGRQVYLLGLAAIFLSGALAGSLRVAVVDAARLTEPGTFSLEGEVVELLGGDRGPRLVVAVSHYEQRGRLQPPGVSDTGLALPDRVRISVPESARFEVGDRLRIRARLFPPAGPVRPGGYDFSFWAYFDRIGATGFSYGMPEYLSDCELSTTVLLYRLVDRIRQETAARIRAVMSPGDAAALAVAVLVGDRSGLSEEGEDLLRTAGLAHVLAISGLHMALFAGGAYAALVLVLSMTEGIALRWPTHKAAALGALISATAYLVLSGASVATQRSYLMIGLVFLGIMVGRKGLSLRSVALAGLLLLVVAPERLLHPGFQMSFAAVICLVAVYGDWSRSQMRQTWTETIGRSGPVRRAGLKVLAFSLGLATTAVVAGLATGIIGAHHFGRYAPLGLLGNMLGMPVFSLVVMPAGVISLVLLPLGLAAYPLAVMEAGLEALLAIAAMTSDVSGGAGQVVPPGSIATLLLLAGLFVMVLGQGARRLLLAGPFILVSAGLMIFQRPPDIQFSDRGTAVAVRSDDGVLRFSSVRSGFATDLWLQAEGEADAVFATRRMREQDHACDNDGCIYRAHAPREIAGEEPPKPILIAVPKTPRALTQDCLRADIIVSDLVAPDNCRAALVVSGSERKKRGALSIWLEDADGRAVISSWRGAREPPPRPWER